MIKLKARREEATIVVESFPWLEGGTGSRQRLFCFDLGWQPVREALGAKLSAEVLERIDLECIAVRCSAVAPMDHVILVMGDHIGDLLSLVQPPGSSRLLKELMSSEQWAELRDLAERLNAVGLRGITLRDIAVSLESHAVSWSASSFVIREAKELLKCAESLGLTLTEEFCTVTGLVDKLGRVPEARKIVVRFDAELRRLEEIDLRFAHLQPVLATGDLPRVIAAAVAALPPMNGTLRQVFRTCIRCENAPAPEAKHPLAKAHGVFGITFGNVQGNPIPIRANGYSAAVPAPMLQQIRRAIACA